MRTPDLQLIGQDLCMQFASGRWGTVSWDSTLNLWHLQLSPGKIELEDTQLTTEELLTLWGKTPMHLVLEVLSGAQEEGKKVFSLEIPFVMGMMVHTRKLSSWEATVGRS
jgi:hypothetical protein